MSLKDNNNSKRAYIVISMLAAVIINNSVKSLKEDYHITSNKIAYEALHKLSVEDIKRYIYSSPYLSEEEKDYLYNPDFIEDALPLINVNFANRLKYETHFHNIAIYSYGEENEERDYLGYYDQDYPSNLYIRGYDSLDGNKDTVAHEWIHLWQCFAGCNVITEACAEIISDEYYDECNNIAYSEQVKIVKKLMEIIGPELIWNFNFNGNFKPIADAVSPYLSEIDYYDFLHCLKFEHGKSLDNINKFKRLNEIIANLYKNKYGEDIENNEIIAALDNFNCQVTRYYFNKRFMDKEHSYYVDRSKKEYASLSYQEAIDRDIFFAYATKYDEISFEEAMELVNAGMTVRRDIDFKTNNIILNRRTDMGIKTTISGSIDGEAVENADVDELAKKGIIQVTYYKVYYKELNGYEYMNKICIKGAKISELYPKNDIVLCEDHVEGMIPVINYVEPICNNLEIKRTLNQNN